MKNFFFFFASSIFLPWITKNVKYLIFKILIINVQRNELMFMQLLMLTNKHFITMSPHIIILLY